MHCWHTVITCLWEEMKIRFEIKCGSALIHEKSTFTVMRKEHAAIFHAIQHIPLEEKAFDGMSSIANIVRRLLFVGRCGECGWFKSV